jgi:phosphoribosylaminoimidazole carboxylase PurE protein
LKKRASPAGRAARKPLVAILMGSDSDLEIMAEAARALREFDVPHEVLVASAHRSPDRTARYVRRAPGRGIRVFIAGAGGAAHLAGVVAAGTILPVIGVPLPGSALNGLDALLATVQMPAGVPVATVAIGKAGARNAGYLAVSILALADARLIERLQRHSENLAAGVEERSRKLPASLARILG